MQKNFGGRGEVGGKGGFSVKNLNFLSVNTEKFIFCAKNEFFQNSDLKKEIFSILYSPVCCIFFIPGMKKLIPGIEKKIRQKLPKTELEMSLKVRHKHLLSIFS